MLVMADTLLLNLSQQYEADDPNYIEREVAYEQLKTWTRQDFGYDVQA